MALQRIAGMLLRLLPGRLRGRPWLSALLRLLALGAGAVGALALAGYAVRASLLFPGYIFGEVAAPAALGLILLAAALWAMSRELPGGRATLLLREDDRIAFAGATVLFAVAAATGLATFAVLQDKVLSIARESVLASQARRAETFVDFIELRESNARIAATRPAALRNLRAIEAGRDDGCQSRQPERRGGELRAGRLLGHRLPRRRRQDGRGRRRLHGRARHRRAPRHARQGGTAVERRLRAAASHRAARRRGRTGQPARRAADAGADAPLARHAAPGRDGRHGAVLPRGRGEKRQAPLLSRALQPEGVLHRVGECRRPAAADDARPAQRDRHRHLPRLPGAQRGGRLRAGRRARPGHGGEDRRRRDLRAGAPAAAAGGRHPPAARRGRRAAAARARQAARRAAGGPEPGPQPPRRGAGGGQPRAGGVLLLGVARPARAAAPYLGLHRHAEGGLRRQAGRIRAALPQDHLGGRGPHGHADRRPAELLAHGPRRHAPRPLLHARSW